jgi:hypothetical protein
MVPRRKQKEFHDQKDAVGFAMVLDVDRGSIQLHLPGGQIANFPDIERMYEAQRLADDK